MYEVIESFTDDVNGGVYYAGRNAYPRAGVEPTKERIAYLLGSGNKLGKPVIRQTQSEPKAPKKPRKTKE